MWWGVVFRAHVETQRHTAPSSPSRGLLRVAADLMEALADDLLKPDFTTADSAAVLRALKDIALNRNLQIVGQAIAPEARADSAENPGKR